jgi:tetratricopeptide (TPR) repeat protein
MAQQVAQAARSATQHRQRPKLRRSREEKTLLEISRSAFLIAHSPEHMADRDKCVLRSERRRKVGSCAPLTYYNRAVARQRKGDLVGAASDYDRAIQVNPRYADAYFNHGAIRYGQGQFDVAISDFSKAIEINRRSGFANVDWPPDSPLRQRR